MSDQATEYDPAIYSGQSALVTAGPGEQSQWQRITWRQLAEIAVGDPDPTPELDGIEAYCFAPHRLPGREMSVYCCWPVGHDPGIQHVSADVGKSVVAVWTGWDPPQGRVWAPRDRRPWVLGAEANGLTPDAWTDDMAAEGRIIGVKRQCSIGWHDECSDPDGDTCRCACHADEETAPAVTRWWHAYGRIRGDLGDVWQLTVISPSTEPPEVAAKLASDAWGDYLTSWDHEPTEAEKDAVTPEDYREEELG